MNGKKISLEKTYKKLGEMYRLGDGIKFYSSLRFKFSIGHEKLLLRYFKELLASNETSLTHFSSSEHHKQDIDLVKSAVTQTTVLIEQVKRELDNSEPHLH